MHNELYKHKQQIDLSLEIYRDLLVQLKLMKNAKASAKINYKSIKMFVANEVDKTGLSKAALKDVVEGDKRVLAAEERLEQCNSDVSTIDAEMAYVKMAYDAEKVYFNAEMQELKQGA